MARRNLLAQDERDRLFLPRIDNFSIIRNYTLAPDDLALIGRRRGADWPAAGLVDTEIS